MQCRSLSNLASSLVILSLPLTAGRAAELAASRSTAIKEQVPPVVKLQAEPFGLPDVRLLDGPFKHAMELDRQHAQIDEASVLLGDARGIC